MFGYSRKELKEVFDDKFQNMVHPDDRDAVAAGVAAMREGRADDAEQLEYRMKSKHRGYLWVVDQSRYLRYEGVSFLQGVGVDVTETVELLSLIHIFLAGLPMANRPNLARRPSEPCRFAVRTLRGYPQNAVRTLHERRGNLARIRCGSIADLARFQMRKIISEQEIYHLPTSSSAA